MPIPDDLLCSIEFTLSVGTVPWNDPSEYVQEIIGIVIGHFNVDEVKIGEISLRLVQVSEAVNQGENLYDVCDSYSAALESIYGHLFDKDGEIREELDIEPAYNNILFVESVELDSGYRDTKVMVQVVETAIATFAPDGLIVAFEKGLELKKEAWKNLGFKRIADSGIVFRDNQKVNPYVK